MKDVLKMKDRLHSYHGNGQHSTPRYGSYPLIEEEVGKWMREMRQRGESMDGKAIKARAIQIAALHGIHDFKASYCWISKVKKRQLPSKPGRNEKNSKRLSIQEKIQVIDLLTAGTEKRAVLKMFGIRSYHVRDILKMKDKLLAYRATGKLDLDKSAIRFEAFPTIDAEVGQWLREMSLQGISVDVKTIQDKAIQVAKAQGIENFKASHTWISKMKKRQLGTAQTSTSSSTSTSASASTSQSTSSHSHSATVWPQHSRVEPQSFLVIQAPIQQQAIQSAQVSNGVVRGRI